MKIAYTGGNLVFTEKDVHRFWLKVKVTDNKDECWEWVGGKQGFGYGTFRLNGRAYTAHRVALTMHEGKEKKGFHVLHSCDNPPCCNPHHLRWGTDKDNHSDAVLRGRHVPPPPSTTKPPVRYGEENNQSKLTEEQVISLREDRGNGMPTMDISREYNISKSTVLQIINFRTWKNAGKRRFLCQ